MQWQDFSHVVRTMLLAQEILVDFASYPTLAIAENSHRFRPLGLGYTNLGGFLMSIGVPYDSRTAEDWTVRITGAMHAVALATSTEIAQAKGAFYNWAENSAGALGVLESHRSTWLGRRPEDMRWVDAIYGSIVADAQKHGLRNAQVTLIAPTGTIGLLMDCDTLGIEPDFAPIKRKTLAEGKELRLVNRTIEAALNQMGYSEPQVNEVLKHIQTTGWPAGAPHLKVEDLPVFDCAIGPEQFPERRVSQAGHLRILAAAQPFLSGAISKTVNLPSQTTVEEIKDLFFEAWKLGLKSVAIYRDGSKTLQPLCMEC